MKRFLLLSLTLLCFYFAKAQIIYVTPSGAGDQTGSSWANATASLTTALELAQTQNADVWVAAGIYFGDTSATQAFIVAPGVKVYGGFSGNEPADYDLGLRDFEVNETILDGDSSRRVLLQIEKDSIALWDGFTIRNGKTPFGYSFENGGGALVIGASLRNCKFTNNRIRIIGQGGGAYAENSVISHCEFYYNETSVTGGGLYTLKSTVNDCDFAYNTSIIDGAGLQTDSSIVTNCRIYNNFSDMGYAIRIINSRLSHCDIFENTSGGICCEYSTMTHSHILNNSGYTQGGASLWVSRISNCLIHNNTVTCTDPDEIYLRAAGATVTNSIITNSTIVNNLGLKTIKFGESIFNNPADTITNRIINSIIWNNRTFGDSIAPIIGEMEPNTIRYSALEEDFGNETNIILTEDPGFILPLDIVGVDSTMQEFNYRLEESSMCVNSGSNAVVTDDFDLAGNIRIQQEIVDMGCYEFGEGNGDATNIEEYADEVNVYPNPTSGILNISGTSFTEVEVYDGFGKKITTYSTSENCDAINLSSYAPGIYIIRILDNNQERAAKKIIKQ